MLLEYRRLEPKYPNRAGRGAGVGDGGGVEGGLILEMGLSSVKCGAMFGNNPLAFPEHSFGPTAQDAS